MKRILSILSILSMALFCGFAAKPLATAFPLSSPAPVQTGVGKLFFQDSLPPLHTIKGEDIDEISSSFEEQTITVKLKGGVTYTYHHIDWDYEDFNPATDQRLAELVKHMQATFTKVENPPQYPGGREAWDKYMNEFCIRHKKEIKRHVPAEITVQFIVHMKGQLEYIQVLGEGTDSKLAPLAIQAIRESQPWLPAIQNGHNVVSYSRQLVRFEL
jgi:hypothetical protein